MKLVDISITEGMFSTKKSFSDSVNLIYSKKNTSGKTTFLRMILYAMGYPVPSMKGIKFSDLEFNLTVKNNNELYVIYRRGPYLTIEHNNKQTEYSLPTDFYEIINVLTGCSNHDIVDNMLGAFYVDQEKGWTLLNRGKVIGDIRFNIEALVRGLGGKDCEEKIKQLNYVKYQLKKYEYMYSVSEYQRKINEESNNLVYTTTDEAMIRKIEYLENELNPILEEMNQIRNILRKNKKFAQFIAEMKLVVRGPNGEEIPVTLENLVGFSDNNQYLVTRRDLLATEKENIKKQIELIKQQKRNNEGLFKVQSLIEAFDSNINTMQVNPVATKNVIEQLKQERKRLQEQIREITKTGNSVVKEMHTIISGYAKELGIDDTYVSPSKDYIFTDDLKSLSGAVLHKIVFSFKLAYIRLIERKTGVILPIILDSPSGREVKTETVKEMLKLLQRDFSNHQIIIASIYDFDLNNKNIIEFKNRVLEDSI